MISDKEVIDELESRTKNCYGEKFVFLPWKPGVSDIQNYADKKLVDIDCAFCNGVTEVKEEMLDHLCGNKRADLKPDISVREVGPGVYQKLFRVGHVLDIENLLRKVAEFRYWNMEDLVVKWGADYGGKTMKFMLNITTESYIDLCITEQIPLCTPDTVFFVSASLAKETYESTKALYHAADMDTLYRLANSGAIKKVIAVPDLSQRMNLLGMSSGNCKFPCDEC